MIKKNNLGAIFTFFICTMPIFHQYASIIPNITLGEFFFICLIPLTIYKYIKCKITINIKSPYTMFILIMTISNLFSALIQDSFDYGAVIVLFGRLYFYFFIIVIMGKLYFDFELGLKIYMTLGKITSIYLILQTIAFYLFKTVLPTIFTFIPLYNNATYHMINFEDMYSRLFRPQSIFLEPGTFAQYVLPCLALALFGSKVCNYKQNIKLAILLTVALVLSLSAQGFIIASIVWGIWIVGSKKQMSTYKKVFFMIFGMMGLVVGIFLIYNVEFLYNGTIGRFNGTGGYDSTGVRVIRGFQVFGQLGWIYKLIGVGFGNVTTFVLQHNIRTPNDLYAMGPNGRIYNFEYMNGIAYILVTAGIISFLVFLIFMIKMFLNTSTYSRVSIVILMLYSIVAGVIISPTWVIMMSFIYKEYEHKVLLNRKKIYEN